MLAEVILRSNKLNFTTMYFTESHST